MWPWEHLAFGYLLYSAYTHLRHARSPTGGPVLVLAVATQFPDLVDKPLAWTFGVLPNGLSLAHSVLFAVPVIVIVAAATRRIGAPQYGSAVAIGYASHLVGDVIYTAVWNAFTVEFLFWPIVARPEREPMGFVTKFVELFSKFVAVLGTPRGMGYLLLELGVLAAVLALWVRDGRPGWHVTVDFVTRRRPDR